MLREVWRFLRGMWGTLAVLAGGYLSGFSYGRDLWWGLMLAYVLVLAGGAHGGYRLALDRRRREQIAELESMNGLLTRVLGIVRGER